MAGKMRRSFLENWASLYSNQTPAEFCLEPHVAYLGLRYRTQHPFWGLKIIPDYVLPDIKLIIEVDDDSHKQKAKRIKDEEKTLKLNKLGWTVVRCTNDEATENPGGTLKRMLESVNLGHLYKTALED